MSWNHPDMPWDASTLQVAVLHPRKGCEVANAVKVAGGTEESICLPVWSPAGDLYYCSDSSGWWNIFRSSQASGFREQQLVCSRKNSEFGLPQWQFGQSTYGFTSDNKMFCAYKSQGVSGLGFVDLSMEQTATAPIEVTLPFTSIIGVTCSGTKLCFSGASQTQFSRVVVYDTTTGELETVRSCSSIEIDPGYISPGKFIEFPTTEGQTAFGMYYEPRNKDFEGQQAVVGSRPPLLVKTHGGPTSSMASCLNLSIQFWTSRGIAVLDVDYRGSANYGRTFRNYLYGKWGILDMEDCASGALHLSRPVVEGGLGLVDGNRMAVTGGSAGGYTTLCALAFKSVFGAGASHYGVGDLETLARDTHKFESRYLDRLVAPYPEGRDVYYARSPVHFASNIRCPVIFFQGLDDKIVLPNQAEAMVEALRANGTTVKYITFEGEGHGFRRAANIIQALDQELLFYSKVFNFVPADHITEI